MFGPNNFLGQITLLFSTWNFNGVPLAPLILNKSSEKGWGANFLCWVKVSTSGGWKNMRKTASSVVRGWISHGAEQGLKIFLSDPLPYTLQLKALVQDTFHFYLTTDCFWSRPSIQHNNQRVSISWGYNWNVHDFMSRFLLMLEFGVRNEIYRSSDNFRIRDEFFTKYTSMSTNT